MIRNSSPSPRYESCDKTQCECHPRRTHDEIEVLCLLSPRVPEREALHQLVPLECAPEAHEQRAVAARRCGGGEPGVEGQYHGGLE